MRIGSLFCRSAPRPILQRRGRSWGPREPAFTRRTGEPAGSGSRDLTLSQEVAMNKSETTFLPCDIEISCKVLVINLSGKAPCEFANTPTGHQCLIRWLQLAGSQIRICMEATGLYGLDLALALHAAGIAFMIVHPRSARNFARAMMQRSKTDRLDAILLREFAPPIPFHPPRPPPPPPPPLMPLPHPL